MRKHRGRCSDCKHYRTYRDGNQLFVFYECGKMEKFLRRPRRKRKCKHYEDFKEVK